MSIAKFLQFIFLFFILISSSHAETYKDFAPGSTFKNIKERYQNASFEQIKAAWVKQDEFFIKMTGVGISGEIYLKFSSLDSFYKSLLENTNKEIEANPGGDNTKNLGLVDGITKALNEPLDQRLSLDWVRWIPPTPLPKERIENKYGTPEKCDYDEETFKPYCSWDSKGVNILLADDKKSVYAIEYSFTDNDWRKVNGTYKALEKPANKPKSKKQISF